MLGKLVGMGTYLDRPSTCLRTKEQPSKKNLPE